MRIFYRRESNSVINRRLSFLIVNLVFFYSFLPFYVHFVSGLWLFLCRMWNRTVLICLILKKMIFGKHKHGTRRQ